ncbi:FbpB family small basic protein [Anaerobacillus sp. MEB173]
MRRHKKISFDELVRENKKKLLSDPAAIMKIEKKLDERHQVKESIQTK